METKKIDKDIMQFGNYVCFWGSVFSNFYPCTIKAEGQTFRSSEQYFMWQKAKHFGDDVIAQAILDAEGPKQAKALGRRVAGFDTEEWHKVSFEKMYNAVYAKFTQNRKLKNILTDKSLDGKTFVEGSPIDFIWGVGIRWDDPMIADEANWRGENRLGKVLNKVRQDILDGGRK